MEIEKIEQSNGNLLLEFQEKLDFVLPNDYLDFLKTNDGARVVDGYFYVESLKEFILMDVFYGVNTDESINLVSINNEFKEDIPEQSLLIGEDPGGAFILLIGKEIESSFTDGIYFYDHSYFFESSNDENNTYFICKTFTEFLQLLETTKPEK